MKYLITLLLSFILLSATAQQVYQNKSFTWFPYQGQTLTVGRYHGYFTPDSLIILDKDTLGWHPLYNGVFTVHDNSLYRWDSTNVLWNTIAGGGGGSETWEQTLNNQGTTPFTTNNNINLGSNKLGIGNFDTLRFGNANYNNGKYYNSFGTEYYRDSTNGVESIFTTLGVPYDDSDFAGHYLHEGSFSYINQSEKNITTGLDESSGNRGNSYIDMQATANSDSTFNSAGIGINSFYSNIGSGGNENTSSNIGTGSFKTNIGSQSVIESSYTNDAQADSNGLTRSEAINANVSYNNGYVQISSSTIYDSLGTHTSSPSAFIVDNVEDTASPIKFIWENNYTFTTYTLKFPRFDYPLGQTTEHFMPVSVNGNYADSTGNIILSGGGSVTSVAFASTDLSVSGSPITTSGTITSNINSNAVTNAKFRQSAGLSVVGNSTNSTANVADITAGSDKTALSRNGTSIGFNTLDSSYLTGMHTQNYYNTVYANIPTGVNGSVQVKNGSALKGYNGDSLRYDGTYLWTKNIYASTAANGVLTLGSDTTTSGNTTDAVHVITGNNAGNVFSFTHAGGLDW